MSDQPRDHGGFDLEADGVLVLERFLPQPLLEALRQVIRF
jgi:hypothetical protein